MKKLEDYIKNNREAFEEELPKGHIKRFEDKMCKRNNLLLRYKNRFAIAASILVLLMVGGYFFVSNPSQFKAFLANPLEESPLPQEVKTAMNYYNAMTASHVKEINTLNLSENEIQKVKNFAGKELKQYEKNARELKRQLRQHPENEALKRALITNQMKKNQFVKRIVKRVRNTKLQRYENKK